MPPNNETAINTIIRTLAGLAGLCAFTECLLSVLSMPIPDQLDRLLTFLAGSLAAMLVKTTPTGPQPAV